MKSQIKNVLSALFGVMLAALLMAGMVNAQSSLAPKEVSVSKKAADKNSTKTPADTAPTSATVGEDAGDFTVTSTIEFGYRGQRVDGDVNKFKSDLNYKAGPRLFDSTLLMKSKDGGKGDLFNTLLVTSTGWGADPYGNIRISAEKPELYRFVFSYRRFKYYRLLYFLARRIELLTPGPTGAKGVTGENG